MDAMNFVKESPNTNNTIQNMFCSFDVFNHSHGTGFVLEPFELRPRKFCFKNCAVKKESVGPI